MLYAIKDNKQTQISEEEKQKFIDGGYKIGELVKDKLVFEVVETKESKEIEQLKVKVAELEKELEKAKKEGK